VKENYKLSRRDFIKLTGLGFAGFVLKPKESGLYWPKEVVSRIETDKPEYALTIDDGWRPDSLVTMLDILKEKGVKADFFLVGTAAISCEGKYPGILSRLADEGHRIAYHTYSHDGNEIQKAKSSWLSSDYDDWMSLFKSILGSARFKKAFFRGARAPGGAFTDEFIRFTQKKGLTPYGWFSDPSTFNRGIPIKKGEILLLHVRFSDEDYLARLDEFTDGPLIPTTISCLQSQESCVSSCIKERDRLDNKLNKMEEIFRDDNR